MQVGLAGLALAPLGCCSRATGGTGLGIHRVRSAKPESIHGATLQALSGIQSKSNKYFSLLMLYSSRNALQVLGSPPWRTGFNDLVPYRPLKNGNLVRTHTMFSSHSLSNVGYGWVSAFVVVRVLLEVCAVSAHLGMYSLESNTQHFNLLKSFLSRHDYWSALGPHFSEDRWLPIPNPFAMMSP